MARKGIEKARLARFVRPFVFNQTMLCPTLILEWLLGRREISMERSRPTGK